jgi:hypothetical protein
MIFAGELEGHPFEQECIGRILQHHPLINRGFHWVNEYTFTVEVDHIFLIRIGARGRVSKPTTHLVKKGLQKKSRSPRYQNRKR